MGRSALPQGLQTTQPYLGAVYGYGQGEVDFFHITHDAREVEVVALHQLPGRGVSLLRMAWHIPSHFIKALDALDVEGCAADTSFVCGVAIGSSIMLEQKRASVSDTCMRMLCTRVHVCTRAKMHKVGSSKQRLSRWAMSQANRQVPASGAVACTLGSLIYQDPTMPCLAALILQDVFINVFLCATKIEGLPVHIFVLPRNQLFHCSARGVRLPAYPPSCLSIYPAKVPCHGLHQHSACS